LRSSAWDTRCVSTLAADLERHAVLLDAAGTLVELQPPAPLLQRILLERHGIAVPLADSSRGMRAEIAYYRAHMYEGIDVATVTALRDRCAEELRRALRSAAPDVARLSRSEMTDALLGSLLFRVFEDVLPALSAIRSAGVRTVVVSNWDAALEGLLVELGLRRQLDAVVSSGAFGVAKPDPAIFLEALRRVGIAPEHALHVGDSLVDDVQGARAAGVEPVLLARDGAGGTSHPEPVSAAGEVRVIGSLGELVGLVRA
jgi:putative hydrolase of the HAD superfamily